VGFEPTEAIETSEVFKTSALNRSATLPHSSCAVTPNVEKVDLTHRFAALDHSIADPAFSINLITLMLPENKTLAEAMSSTDGWNVGWLIGR
jgi:hypothetical protein